jgi:hypothetical protein
MVGLIAVLLGLLLGLAWTGAVFFYLASTRPYRRERNLLAIRTGYIAVGILAPGSLFLLLSLCNRLGIDFHSRTHDASMWAYILGTGCIVFFGVRAEIRWRKTWWNLK